MEAAILFAHRNAIPSGQVIQRHRALDDALIHGKKKFQQIFQLS